MVYPAGGNNKMVTSNSSIPSVMLHLLLGLLHQPDQPLAGGEAEHHLPRLHYTIQLAFSRYLFLM